MAKHINIGMLKHQEQMLQKVFKPGSSYTEATGRQERAKYTDSWETLLQYFNSYTAGTTEGEQVTLTLERLPGDVGELVVQRDYYTVPEGGSGEEDEESGGGGAELGTESAPCYTCSSSTVQECILAHPKFENIGDLPRRALKAMIDGQDENSFLEDEGSESGHRKIKDCIGSDEAAQLAFKLIGKGITSFLNVQTEITARWKGRSNKYSVGEIVSTPPGGFKAISGRDYLVVGSGVEKTGAETWCSATFRMSGAGGWKKELYSDS